MRHHLLAGIALCTFAPAIALGQPSSPAPINSDDQPAPDAPSTVPDKAVGYEGSSGLDDLAPADPSIVSEPAAPAPVASTGDPVLDRLNALEAKVKALEARNAELEKQASFTADRVEKVEVRAAKGVQPGVAPTFADVNGNFTFKPRGVFQLDHAAFNERAGGYNYSNGTLIRRGRIGFDGTAYKNFRWRFEVELVGQQASILDAYVQYVATPQWVLTVGQHKAPYGLEANTSDNFNTLLERGMASNAFGAVGAERRIGISATYVTDKLNAQAGIFGAPESLTRANSFPDETWGFNGRVTFDPVLDTGRVVHVGASGYVVNNLRDGTAVGQVRVQERPNVRVDDGRIANVAVPFVKQARYVGGEGAVVFGPFSVQGEYGRLRLDRSGARPDVDFDGGYVFGSYFVTGEARTFKNGVVDRLKPFADFNPGAGTWGALELVLRYDVLSLTDRGLSPLDRKADSWTAAVNWYLNPNTKLLFNYVRFKGENSPLVVAPVALNGTTAKGDAFATRLHFDF